jgi:heme/copper-type cytochrome/quinol oxidase subunit 2
MFSGKVGYQLKDALIVLAAVVACGAVGYLAAPEPPPPQERAITIRARQYAFEPEVLRVNRGDTLRLSFISEDVVHGFFLEGHDLDVKIFPLEPEFEVTRPSSPDSSERVREVVLTVEKEGKYRYRCSHTCGYMHPFMQGEMIVAPNRLLPASMGMGFGVLLGSLAVTARRRKSP